jgi:hypothetical protein
MGTKASATAADINRIFGALEIYRKIRNDETAKGEDSRR